MYVRMSMYITCTPVYVIYIISLSATLQGVSAVPDPLQTVLVPGPGPRQTTRGDHLTKHHCQYHAQTGMYCMYVLYTCTNCMYSTYMYIHVCMYIYTLCIYVHVQLSDARYMYIHVYTYSIRFVC